MSTPVDRRPWLIISRREAIALAEAALLTQADMNPDLARALNQINLQVAFIDHGLAAGAPSIPAALRRNSG